MLCHLTAKLDYLKILKFKISTSKQEISMWRSNPLLRKDLQSNKHQISTILIFIKNVP